MKDSKTEWGLGAKGPMSLETLKHEKMGGSWVRKLGKRVPAKKGPVAFRAQGGVDGVSGVGWQNEFTLQRVTPSRSPCDVRIGTS